MKWFCENFRFLDFFKMCQNPALAYYLNMLIHANQKLQYRVMYTHFTPIYNRV